VADVFPVIRLDVCKERIQSLDIIAVHESPDLFEVFGSHQHVACTGRGINHVHGCPAMLLNGLPEIVGKFGRHGTFPGSNWVVPLYSDRLIQASEKKKGRATRQR
jgi:hypothetical protein